MTWSQLFELNFDETIMWNLMVIIRASLLVFGLDWITKKICIRINRKRKEEQEKTHKATTKIYSINDKGLS